MVDKNKEGNGQKLLLWEDQQNKSYALSPLKLASSPKACELLKEASNDWDMAKSMGVKYSNQENKMIIKMVSMEERDKGEAQKLGNSEGD